MNKAQIITNQHEQSTNGAVGVDLELLALCCPPPLALCRRAAPPPLAPSGDRGRRRCHREGPEGAGGGAGAGGLEPGGQPHLRGWTPGPPCVASTGGPRARPSAAGPCARDLLRPRLPTTEQEHRRRPSQAGG
ncbi:hypothetical protein C2845_PM04G02520 [Panicum miliaceum]|uniref:Uncharacterized protein n=1 Tax=Panicum miliaceum TaxID=4540 RepID=A0A3L6QLZ0_PANMI|nr:hypothetical protein C2845_PM04G02520 [Panicum miliaceum]